MTEPIFKNTLDEFFETQAIGSTARAIGNNLYGFNHQQLPKVIPINKDCYGLTFFTRPQLNLTSSNIRNVRRFYDLLNEEELSVQRYVRCMLDPRLQDFKSTAIPGADNMGVSSPLVDNKQAFIPLLTNALVSLAGWPDISVETYTSKPGLYKENYTQVDNVDELYKTFEITANFSNTKGDPIMYLFYIWSKYQEYVFEGRLAPYPDFIIGNRLDYNTRIYRLVLDQSKRYVTKIACLAVAFPVGLNIGQAFDFTTDKIYNEQNKELGVRFKVIGCEYYDPIIALEFNRTVEAFNPNMKCGWWGEDQPTEMQKVPFNILRIFNYTGYPRINLDTYELEWWVDKETWDIISEAYLSQYKDTYFIDYNKFLTDKNLSARQDDDPYNNVIVEDKSTQKTGEGAGYSGSVTNSAASNEANNADIYNQVK